MQRKIILLLLLCFCGSCCMAQDYRATVLLDKDGAGGFGHAALLLFNGETDGYLLYSKGKKADQWVSEGKYYRSLDSLERQLSRYGHTFTFAISKEEFRKMNYAAGKIVRDDYDLIGNNCFTLVLYAFANAGFDIGSDLSPFTGKFLPETEKIIPIEGFEMLKKSISRSRPVAASDGSELQCLYRQLDDTQRQIAELEAQIEKLQP